MAQTIFFIIIAILVFNFLLERILFLLNKKRWNLPIPTELADVYDVDKYQKMQEYRKHSAKFSLLFAIWSFLIILLFLTLGGVPLVDSWARSIMPNAIVVALIFTAIIGWTSDILDTPFDVYGTFVLEQKFGFNTSTVKTFIFDKLKGWLLGAIIGGCLLALFIWFYQTTGTFFWLWAWFAFSAFTLFMTYFYSDIIVPLFNKQKPLEEGELRSAIEAMCTKAEFPLDNVYVIDGSKRSKRANAYFTGLGKRKRIVLYDTLIEQLSIEEITAVLAHEIGHYKHKHSIWGLVSGAVQTLASLYILSLMLNYQVFTDALGVYVPAIHVGIFAFGILYSPVSLILGIVGNYYSRKHEYTADAFAASLHLGDALISGLKKLSANNFSNLNPHNAYVFFHYSHPTLLQRVQAVNKLKSC
jgi:STE24 endopeptidase